MIELACNKPEGWLDTDHSSGSSQAFSSKQQQSLLLSSNIQKSCNPAESKSASLASTLSAEEVELLTAFRLATNEQLAMMTALTGVVLGSLTKSVGQILSMPSIGETADVIKPKGTIDR